MPVDYSKYHPDWASISHQIRVERAENRCEWCRAPNGETIARGHVGRIPAYMLIDGRVFDADDGTPISLGSHGTFTLSKQVKIILTVAHLDHNETDHNAPLERLAALCQRCHLNLDRRDNYLRRFHRGQFALEFASYPFYAPLRLNN